MHDRIGMIEDMRVHVQGKIKMTKDMVQDRTEMIEAMQ